MSGFHVVLYGDEHPVVISTTLVLNIKNIIKTFEMVSMNDIVDSVLEHRNVADEVRADTLKYIHYGGFLGCICYFLTHLAIDDSDTSERAAKLPTLAAVASFLHDDAVDELDTASGNELKQIQNSRIVVGDLALIHLVKHLGELQKVTDESKEDFLGTLAQIGEIQLNEESQNGGNLSVEMSRQQLEEKASIWGKLTAETLNILDIYDKSERDLVKNIISDFMIILTLSDDIKDIHKDYENSVATYPQVLLSNCSDTNLESYRGRTELISEFLSSEAIADIREYINERHNAIDSNLRELYQSIDSTDEELTQCWNCAIDWYNSELANIDHDVTVTEKYVSDVQRLEQNDTSQEVAHKVLFYAFDQFPIELTNDSQVIDRIVSKSDKLFVPFVIPEGIDDAIRALESSIEKRGNNK